MLPSNCTQKVNGKALLLDQAGRRPLNWVDPVWNRQRITEEKKLTVVWIFLYFPCILETEGAAAEIAKDGFSVNRLLLCKFKETEPKHRLCQKENIMAPVISTLNYPTNRLSPSKGKSQFTATQALIVWASAAQEVISVSIKSQWSYKRCHSSVPAILISPSRWKTKAHTLPVNWGMYYF